MKLELLATFTSTEDGIESAVFAREDGLFAVTFVDVDAGEKLGPTERFPERERAFAHARKLVGAPEPAATS
jgi:hypothetical protein